MDFLSKFLQRKPPKSGGGSPTASSTPTVPVKPDHEAHVQFAREFVVELVETIPKKSEKAALAKVADKEDIVSLKSVSPSESSFQSVNSVTENTSLPDLLQPESVYKKQTDTDTDTTEYESAAETDPLDAVSPIENLIAEDIVTGFQEALDKKQSPSEAQKQSSDNSVSQASEPSPLSEAYEDVGDTVVKSGGENEVKSLDISGLCLFVSNLCLDSPKRSDDSELPGDKKDSLNNSSDIVLDNSVVTEQSIASVSDSTFLVEDNCARVNESLGDSQSAYDQFKATTQIGSGISSTNLPTVIPGNTLVSPERTLETGLLESITVVKQELENAPEVTSAKSLKVLPAESSIIKQADVSSENTLEVTTKLPVELSEVNQTENTFEETSTSFSEELPLNSAEIKLSENNLEITPEHLEILTVTSSEVIKAEISSETIPEVKSKFPEVLLVKSVEESFEKTKVSPVKITEVLGKIHEVTSEQLAKLTSDFHEISVEESVQIPTGETVEVATATPDVSSIEPREVLQGNTSQVKSNEILELIDSLVKETELSSEVTCEELPVKPLGTLSGKTPDTTPIKLTEIILRNFEQSPVKPDEILEKTVEAASVIPTEVSKDSFEISLTLETSKLKNLEQSPVKLDEILEKTVEAASVIPTEVLQVKSTEAYPRELELSTEETPETSPKTPTGEPFITTESPEVLLRKPAEKTSEGTAVTLADETNVLDVIFRQEQPVVSESIPVQNSKSQEAEAESNKGETVDAAQEWTSEPDICSSESIPVEETPSVASVTNSIEEKLLESKDFSTSFEVLSSEKEVPSELVEEKVQIETVQSAKESSQKWSPAKLANSSADIGAGDYKLQEAKKEVEKKAPTVLTELFEICNRQQKDLDLGDEKFVDGREFFDPPSISTNLNETVVVSSSQTELSETVTRENYGDFDDSIAEEAEKIYQEIINASSHLNDCSVNSSGSKTQQISKMADLRSGSNSTTAIADDGMNPFLTQSSLRRSPPPSSKHSPRSSSQGPSPADSPRMRSKLSSVNQTRDNSLPRDVTGDASPRSRSGKNSPDRRISSNRVSSLEGSPKNSIISSEINQSEAGPEIADEAPGGDVFRDPSTFDFLNSVGNSNIVTDLRKESLYVKFDPLVGGARTIDQSVPLPPAVEAKSNNIGLSASSSPHESFSNNITPPRNVAISVVDKLISLSPSPRKQQIESPVKQVITPVSTPVKEEPQNYTDNSSMVEELYLLREILAKQDEKHREEVLMQQQKFEHLQAKMKEYEEREARLNKKVAEKAQGQKQMSIIMEEYEKTISRLVAEKEQERQAHEIDRASLLKERDTVTGHLANIEIAFSDLHKKYERSKTVIEGFKKNEEVLRASLADYEATIRKQEQKYDVLKSHAMAQLENANQELDSVKRSQQAEGAKLKAMLKKAEVKTSSLEEMLEQKVKENQELASICDELINKVGSSD